MRLVGLITLIAVVTPAAGAAQAMRGVADSAVVAEADARYQKQDYAAAAPLYAKVVAARPGDGRSWYRYGVSLYRTRDVAGAAGAFERAAAIGANPYAVFNAASTNAELGRRERALMWLDSAVSVGVRSEQLIRGDSALRRYEQDPKFQAILARVRRLMRPCADRAASHRFDFWVGDWDVTNAQGQPAGHNTIQQILEQCVLLENWTDAAGGQGKSFSAYNPERDMWQQFWVDQYGRVTEYRDSEWDGTTLRFLARVVTPKGEKQLWRMSFTPIDSVTVRQWGEASTDEGKTWTVTWDLYYHKKK